jgi:hypothetical protein
MGVVDKSMIIGYMTLLSIQFSFSIFPKATYVSSLTSFNRKVDFVEIGGFLYFGGRQIQKSSDLGKIGFQVDYDVAS